MATQSPFSFVGSVFERMAAGPQPPQWLVHEVQHRVVLLLNHVLMQESAATQRLVPSRGRVVRMQWRHFFMALRDNLSKISPNQIDSKEFGHRFAGAGDPEVRELFRENLTEEDYGRIIAGYTEELKKGPVQRPALGN